MDGMDGILNTSSFNAPFLQYERYGVLGAGRSGKAAAAALLDLGKQVTIHDDFATDDEPAIAELVHRGALLRLGEQAVELGDAQAIVVSPGVAPDHPLLTRAATEGIPARAELELGWLLADGAPIVAITGTNGKTTVTMLIQRIFEDAGIRSVAAGNIGLPLCEAVRADADAAKTVYVVEVSSFQLETVDQFTPQVAVILNVTPDHLDRHPTLEAYARAKARLTDRQSPDQVLVVNQDDPFCQAIAARTRARTMRFSLERPVDDGVRLDGDRIVLEQPNDAPQPILTAGELQMIGQHNIANSMAAACAALAMGVAPQAIASTLRNFRAAPHRMERIAERDGVSYINDSKATNLGAMRRAIESFEGGIHLIAGGRDKNSPFATVAELIADRVRRVYLIGEAAEPMERAWGDRLPCDRCETLERALAVASDRTQAGEIVLLSPGCASFDQFRSYGHRGEVFTQWVRDRLGGDPS